MILTITIDTDHPDAWENLRADLEMLVGEGDVHGPYANAVQMTEAVLEGMAPRRTFTAERDPSELDPVTA